MVGNAAPAVPRSYMVTVKIARTRTGSLCFGLGERDSVGVDCKPGDAISFLPLMWMAHTGQFYFQNRPLPAGTTRGILIEYNKEQQKVSTGDELTIKHDHLELVISRCVHFVVSRTLFIIVPSYTFEQCTIAS